MQSSFDLIGVIYHIGELSFGHYISACKNPFDLKWHLFNDSKVTEITEENIIDKNAYVLIYKKN